MSVTGFNRRRRELEAREQETTKAPSLEDMTKTELLVFAETQGIDGLDDRMLKADMIAAIKAVI